MGKKNNKRKKKLQRIRMQMLNNNYCLFYGSLRKDEYNYERFIHRYGKDSLTYVETIKLKGYRMYSLGSYPAVVYTNDDTEITVDVMRVSNDAYESIKFMELGAGYGEYKIPCNIKFANEQLELEGTIYLFNSLKDVEGLEEVTSGDWIKFNSKPVEAYEQ